MALAAAQIEDQPSAKAPTSALQSRNRPNIDANSYDAWLVDLDGTLYRQTPVRLAMAVELLLCGTKHVRVISRFRREQERLRTATSDGTCPYQSQIARTAKTLNLHENQITPVVREWMERRPGKWLRLFSRRRLLRQIAAFRETGGKTALVSDYPARQKLSALRAEALFDIVIACGESGGPLHLKPSPEGYLLACQHLGLDPARCLVIGDRDDADGQAAQAGGMSFLNISKFAA